MNSLRQRLGLSTPSECRQIVLPDSGLPPHKVLNPKGNWYLSGHHIWYTVFQGRRYTYYRHKWYREHEDQSFKRQRSASEGRPLLRSGDAWFEEAPRATANLLHEGWRYEQDAQEAAVAASHEPLEDDEEEEEEERRQFAEEAPRAGTETLRSVGSSVPSLTDGSSNGSLASVETPEGQLPLLTRQARRADPDGRLSVASTLVDGSEEVGSNSDSDSDSDDFDVEEREGVVQAARDEVLIAALEVHTASTIRNDARPNNYRDLLRIFSRRLEQYESLEPPAPRLTRADIPWVQRFRLREEWFREKRRITQDFGEKREQAQRRLQRASEQDLTRALQRLDESNCHAGRPPHQQDQNAAGWMRRAVGRLLHPWGPSYPYVSYEESRALRATKAAALAAALAQTRQRLHDEEAVAMGETAALFAQYIFAHMEPEDRVPWLLGAVNFDE